MPGMDTSQAPILTIHRFVCVGSSVRIEFCSVLFCVPWFQISLDELKHISRMRQHLPRLLKARVCRGHGAHLFNPSRIRDVSAARHVDLPELHLPGRSTGTSDDLDRALQLWHLVLALVAWAHVRADVRMPELHFHLLGEMGHCAVSVRIPPTGPSSSRQLLDPPLRCPGTTCDGHAGP